VEDMAKALIRKGDMTTHGGKVIEGFSDYTIQGIPVAGVGHKTICPLCKGVFPIIQGYGGITVNGIFVALDGHVTACGAKLIPSQHEEVVDDGGGGDVMGATAQSEQAKYASLSDNQRSMINDGVYRPDQDRGGITQIAAEEDDNLNPSRFRDETGKETDLSEWSNQQNYNTLLNEARELAKKDGFRYDVMRDPNKPYTQEDVDGLQRDIDKIKRGDFLEQRLQKAEQLSRHPAWSADTKILKQMKKRGWTENDINEVIKRGPTGKSQDTRWTNEGKRLDDSATVYGEPGNYVIINNRTGDVTQVSGKTDSEWTDDSRIEWTK